MQRTKPRVVLDTNVVISRLLLPHSETASMVRKIIDQSVLLVSQATIDELITVLQKPKIQKYINNEDVASFLYAYKEVAEWIPILEHITVCRDPKDDKFLALAVNGYATTIVSGDQDLLILHPFRTIEIAPPAIVAARLLAA